ncbi:MAG: DUF429 domain-containing protein [Candidatus Thermoplasmatota archaeon]|nr:DUF429 domain-containing protein [Candidatus Thermoplasmatota archaeon]
MTSLGIDLAGKEKNKTGICILDGNVPKTFVLHTDSEIIECVKATKPDIVAIDAPFLLKPKIRKCDRELKKYGAFAPIMKSMHELSKRGYLLAKELEKLNFKVIEVFPTASAKILGIYSKDLAVAKRNLSELGLILKNKIFTKHELDAIISAYTGALYLRNLTEDVGDAVEGTIVVPKMKKLLF